MTSPSPQHYRFEGRRLGIDEAVLANATAVIERLRLIDSRLVPVFTLRHLSELTGVPYGYLRRGVSRRLDNYRHIVLRKRDPGRKQHRLISIPGPKLLSVQRWIVRHILSFTTPSPASSAYHPASSPLFAAAEHCGCDWLLKIDIEDFFHNITERQIWSIFYQLGYPNLLSFELARLTTFVPKEFSSPYIRESSTWSSIKYYQFSSEGVLPQGAPTSPMLSNLVMRPLDDRLIALATRFGMRYTRYADDLSFSCARGRDRLYIERFRQRVLDELANEGFHHNRRKTVIRGPGTRRIVLGILVDRPHPRLPADFKDILRLHMHYLKSPGGPSQHARRRRTSVSTLYHHVRGLIDWASVVEPSYGGRILAEFKEVNWPPIQPRRVELTRE